jgi:hypothetical protein
VRVIGIVVLYLTYETNINRVLRIALTNKPPFTMRGSAAIFFLFVGLASSSSVSLRGKRSLQKKGLWGHLKANDTLITSKPPAVLKGSKSTRSLSPSAAGGLPSGSLSPKGAPLPPPVAHGAPVSKGTAPKMTQAPTAGGAVAQSYGTYVEDGLHSRLLKGFVI